MTTLQLSPAKRIATRTRKTSKLNKLPENAVSADRVREMLLELTFALHATRVVGRIDESPAEDAAQNLAADSAR